MGAVKILCAEKYGCFLCGERSYCTYGKTLPYQNDKGEIIMEGLTAKEVLNELKSRFNMELAETEQKSLNKLRDWVRRGIIEGPSIRTGVQGTGGRQGLYSKELTIYLAVIVFLRDSYGAPLEKIMAVKKKTEEWRNNEMEYGPDSNIILLYHAWNRYCAKLRAGFPFEKHAKVTILKRALPNGKHEILEQVEEDENDSITYSVR